MLNKLDRREAIKALATMVVSLGVTATTRSSQMKVACFIRYEIDPHQLEEFRRYASAWGTIIPRCGGHLVGYFLPHEGTNDIAWGIIGFDSLANYEQYRARLREDADARTNFLFAQDKRFILREERSFCALVPDTFDRAPRG